MYLMRAHRLAFVLLGFCLLSLEPVQAAEAPKLTYPQLRNELMDFADRYMQMVGQAADGLQRENRDPDARAGILSMKLFPVSAAFSIASDSSPQMALLDMFVMVNLQGHVWRKSLPARFKDNAAAMLAVQEKLEDDIEAIAVKALDEGQIVRLKRLVLEWHKANPDQRYVSYIRFTDFAEMRLPGERQGKGPSFSIGGLLSVFQLVNIDEASRSMDDARMVAERALYTTERLPTLLRWQSEMFFYQMAATPEAKTVLETNRSIQTLPERLTTGLLIVAVAVFILAVLYRAIARKLK